MIGIIEDLNVVTASNNNNEQFYTVSYSLGQAQNLLSLLFLH